MIQSVSQSTLRFSQSVRLHYDSVSLHSFGELPAVMVRSVQDNLVLLLFN